MNAREIMYRMSAFLALAIGLTISWLASVYCYLETGFANPIPALVIVYAIVAYDLRWWREMAWRVPTYMTVGGFLLLFLQPVVVANRVEYTRYEGLTHWHSPMTDVNYALVGATIFLVATFLFAPMNKSKDVETLKNSRSLVPNHPCKASVMCSVMIMVF